MNDKLIEMYNAKEAESSLDGLSDSAASLWDEPYKIISRILVDYDIMIDRVLAEFQAKMQNYVTGVVEYYGNMAYQFQYGYQTIYDRSTNRVKYATIDNDARIVKYASAQRTPNGIIVKALKEDSYLTNDEKNALSKYYNGDIYGREGVSFSGTQVTIVSQQGDSIIINANIQINPSIVDINGVNILTGKNDFIDTITSFLRSYQSDSFNSTLYLPKLVDVIQNIEGVKNRNVKITSCIAKPFESSNSIDLVTSETQSYNPYSGYFIVDDDNPLSDTLNFYI